MFNSLVMLGVVGAGAAAVTAYSLSKMYALGQIPPILGRDPRLVGGIAAVGSSLLLGLTGLPSLLLFGGGLGALSSWATTAGQQSAMLALPSGTQAQVNYSQPIYG